MSNPSAARLPAPVRVMIVDDSGFMRTVLARMIDSDPDLRVVGEAQDGVQALERIKALAPDVVTLDVAMPGMDGLSVLRRLMREHPVPVIMVSALTQEGADATLEALEIGAFDCIAKPQSAGSLEVLRIRDGLVTKLKAAGHAGFRHSRAEAPREHVAARAPSTRFQGRIPTVIAVGASTGGPKALQDLLTRLPADLPVGILLVQHMPVGFTAPFARRLDSLCNVNVREAAEGDTVEPGVVLVAPADWHMTAVRHASAKHSVRLSKAPAGMLHRPSVDVLMLSVAEAYGKFAMGVILTGMGDDGARGMKAIFDKGGYTIAQDEASCAVYGMPRACAELGIIKSQSSLDRIANEICDALMTIPRAV